mgnify:CR=1 FL=1
MKTAVGTFAKATSLPEVFVEKIQILPPQGQFTRRQLIDIDISVQIACKDDAPSIRRAKKKLLAGNYMIFAAFAYNAAAMGKILDRPMFIKQCIANPHKKLGPGITKEYLKVSRSQRDIEMVPLGDNRVIIKKLLSFRHDCDPTELKKYNFDLSLYVVPYATDPQASSPSGIKRKLAAMKCGISTSETILSRGKSPMTSVIYTLAEDSGQYGSKGDVWAGSMRWSPKQGYIADVDIAKGRTAKLKATRVSNQKVQDLRFMGAARTLLFDSSPPSAQVRSPRHRRYMATAQKVVTRPPAISNCSFSRSLGGLSILFSVDHARLAKEKTRFGHFIKNESTRQASLVIEDVKIYRQPVQPGNVSPTALTAGRVSVAGAGRHAPGSVPQFVGSLSDGTITERAFEGMDSEVRFFIARDTSILKEVGGTWQYSLEISWVDESTTLLRNVTSDLDKKISQYNRFLAASDAMGAKNFNVRARLKRDRRRAQAVNRQWKRLISAYVGSVEYIFGSSAFENYSSVEWRKNLLSMTNPANGDIKAMRSLSELVRSFSTNLAHMYTKTSVAASSGVFSVKSKIKGQNPSRRKELLVHSFSNFFEQRNVKFTQGTDYLDVTKVASEGGGLASISYANYKIRIDEELTKYSVPRPNDPGVNKFGFMSPKRIILDSTRIETDTLDISQDKGNGILDAYLNPNFKGIATEIDDNRSKKVYNREIDNILGNIGLSVTHNTIPLKDLVRGQKSLSSRTQFSGDYISGSNSFTKNELSAETAISGSNVTGLSAAARARYRSSFNASPLAQRLVSGASVDFAAKQKVPPQISLGDSMAGSLAAEAMVQVPTNFEFNSNFGNAVNFGSLAEVQYFSGYTKTQGVLNIQGPSWQRLTQAKFEKFQQDGKDVLCRVMPLNNELSTPNKYHVDPYDTTFVLQGDAQGAPTRPTPKSLYQSIYKTMQNEMKKVELNIEDASAGVEISYTRNGPLSTKRPSKPQKARAGGRMAARRGGY